MAFTSEQKLIIEHEEGHAMIGACPGSGKTTTMIELVLKLIEKGVAPNDILVLTFGSESQKDFANRLFDRADGRFKLPDVRTFHSLGKKILDAFVNKGLAKDARLETSKKATEMTAMNVIKSCIGQQKFKELTGSNQSIIEDFLSFVDFVKSGFMSPAEVFALLGINPDFKFFIKAFDAFEDNRKKNKVRYFSDLIYDPVNLLVSREDLRKWIGGKKKYIIIDEYQDTNTIQHEFVKIIAGDSSSVIIVGDVDQAIYGWRAAMIELMLHQFEKDFPNPRRYTLSRTFRYGHKLAMMANSVITKNKERHDTLCISGRPDINTEIEVQGYVDSGKHVLGIVQNELTNGRRLNDIAVLVRLYSVAAPVELEFLKAGINYKLQGGYSCLYSREMKNLEFILQIASGQHKFLKKDKLKECYEELFKFPFLGCKGDLSAEFAKKLAAVDDDEDPGRVLSRLRGMEEAAYIRKKIVERAEVLEEIALMGKRGSKPKAILDFYIRSTELYKNMQKMAMSAIEYGERKERCDVFVRYVEGLGNDVLGVLDAFQELREKQFSMSKNEDGVIITSIHKAKGLEWPVVIMPGLENTKFPYEGKSDSLTTVESERRLFFVGMTRAINTLYMLAPMHPELRAELANGNGNVRNLFGDRAEPSPFIFEMRHLMSNNFVRDLEAQKNKESWIDGVFQRYWDEVSRDTFTTA